MKGRKNAIIVLLAVLMTVCGCGKEARVYPEPTETVYNGQTQQERYMQLYMPSEDEKTVLPSLQSVAIAQKKTATMP